MTGLSLVGCSPDAAPSLTVRLQTGLRAGHEVRFVETRLFAGSVPCATSSTPRSLEGVVLAPGDQASLAAGVFGVAEFRGLARGTYTVQVRLRRPPGDPRAGDDTGEVLASRCVLTTLTNDRVVRVALTSDCADVDCPGPEGSPSFTECLNGRCVAAGCDPEDPSTAESCCDRAVLGSACDESPTVCAADSACRPGALCAGEPECIDGACVEPPADECGDGQFCSRSSGECLPVTTGGSDAGVPDAGPELADVGLTDGGPPDAWACVPAPGGACRLIEPQCGCPESAAACVPSGATSSSCVAAGTAGPGEPCTDRGFECRAGLICAEPLSATPGTRTCSELCVDAAECADGRCRAIADGAGGLRTDVGMCRNACRLAPQRGCPAGLSCTLFGVFVEGGVVTVTDCVAPGSRTLGASCDGPRDCAPGLACVSRAGGPEECVRWCDVAAPSCGASERCDSFIRLNGVNWGTCVPA